MSNVKNDTCSLVHDVPLRQLSVVYPYQLDDYRCVSPIDDVDGPLLGVNFDCGFVM